MQSCANANAGVLGTSVSLRNFTLPQLTLIYTSVKPLANTSLSS